MPKLLRCQLKSFVNLNCTCHYFWKEVKKRMLMNTFRPFDDWPVEREHNQKSEVRWYWKFSHDLVALLGTSLHPQPGHFAKCEEVMSMHQLYKDDMKPFRMPVLSTGIDLHNSKNKFHKEPLFHLCLRKVAWMMWCSILSLIGWSDIWTVDLQYWDFCF